MITGNKTIIKGITQESSSLIYKWVNREDLRELTGTLYPISEYEHEEWIKKVATSSDPKLFLICEKQNNQPIGTIGLKKLNYTNRNAELFISIGAEGYTSKGYGSDAVASFVNYCFGSLNLHRIYLHVFESNIGAIKSYEKCGFKKEGVLKDAHFSKGKYENIIIMGKVSSEF